MSWTTVQAEEEQVILISTLLILGLLLCGYGCVRVLMTLMYTCRTCFGLGRYADRHVLEEVTCAGCLGRGFVLRRTV